MIKYTAKNGTIIGERHLLIVEGDIARLKVGDVLETDDAQKLKIDSIATSIDFINGRMLIATRDPVPENLTHLYKFDD